MCCCAGDGGWGWTWNDCFRRRWQSRRETQHGSVHVKSVESIACSHFPNVMRQSSSVTSWIWGLLTKYVDGRGGFRWTVKGNERIDSRSVRVLLRLIFSPSENICVERLTGPSSFPLPQDGMQRDWEWFMNRVDGLKHKYPETLEDAYKVSGSNRWSQVCLPTVGG